MAKSRARVYIDGFNLYHGALSDRRVRWLDIEALAHRLLPGRSIDCVTYCTARIDTTVNAADTVTRQALYLDALTSLSTVKVVEGQFKVRKTAMPRNPRQCCTCCSGGVPCDCCAGPTVRVRRVEEKGSDVNLAVRMVVDASADCFDEALVVSGDSDLQPAVDAVRSLFGKSVLVLDPRGRRSSPLVGTERRTLRAGTLAACQLPDQVQTSTGRVVHRPPHWS